MTTHVHDVARAAGRTDALRSLVSLAGDLGWELGLYDASGVLLTSGDDTQLPPSLDAGGPTLVRAPVAAFGNAVGHVAAQRRREELGPGQPLVDHVAAVLGDLCRQEIEIVDLAREIAGAYEELNLFYDLTTVLAGAREPEVVCGAVLDRALRVTPSCAARIVLRGERDGLRTVASRGDRAHVAVVEGESAAARCVETGRRCSSTSRPRTRRWRSTRGSRRRSDLWPWSRYACSPATTFR